MKEKKYQFGGFEITILILFIVCILLRFTSNFYFPLEYVRNSTMTHLRIDSLLCGVLISYLYHFKFDLLKIYSIKYRYILAIMAFGGLIWTPFIDPVMSFFVKTIGFTLLYLSFGIILVVFLLKNNINYLLDKMFSSFIVDWISKIGFCSYSIYIIHTFVNTLIARGNIRFQIFHSIYLQFLITTILSILIGMFMTFKIEKYFLQLRNKYYPSRI